jgi:tetratricopeptide (TPR) repeat protein
MSLELNLRFPSPAHVIVGLDGEDTVALPFTIPLSREDHEELRWYLETYASRYTTEVDDQRAARLAARLPFWGQALFTAVFQDRAAQRLFNTFQDSAEAGRLLTISAEHPSILALPWELLHDPSSGGTFLFHEYPRISIRRRMPGATGGRRPRRVQTRLQLRLLFVISRPEDASFIDPRADAQAMLDALETHAPSAVEVEFLRPATLAKLIERLENTDLPPVDIVHFDGHGVFDSDGRLSTAQERQGALPTHRPDLLRTADLQPGPNTGYLLFENAAGRTHYVSAPLLGAMLHRQQVAMVVLSACQSAMLGDSEEPMGSVAVRLTAAGIPAVLAMTHAVLVATTRQLFGELYGHLARGQSIGASLDTARRALYSHPDKHTVQRGPTRVTLQLHDWFVPALYQAGPDIPLLQTPTAASPAAARPVWHNLPAVQEAGFFGRRWELWDIERWYVHGTRRLTITGFGGQGKTVLAQEAGYWLLRTGLFQVVVFVDYAAFQGTDPVGLACSTLAAGLHTNVLDADAATEVLRHTPTLLILDNLEALPTATLRELLDSAHAWSEAGDSRVLCTTRTPDLQHPAYPTANSHRHRVLQLAGLAEDDALRYFQALHDLPPAPETPPPARDGLLTLFRLVDFHPLSIGLLAQQLKTRRVAELGERLQALLAETPHNPLLASLHLSLERVDNAAHVWLPQLGVFQGGALEPNLLEITGIPEAQWSAVRQSLVATALIQPEYLPGVEVPYLKFHPTLAPALWERLLPAQQADLSARHCQRYYALSDYLYNKDIHNTHQARAITRRELPNLLHAVHGALEVGEEWTVDFVYKVSFFLNVFGLHRDWTVLTQRVQAGGWQMGSRAWWLARLNHGERLWAEGQSHAAAAVFQEVLAGLRESPSYERGDALTWLGRYFHLQGQPRQAVQYYRQAMAVLEQVDTSMAVQELQRVLQADLGDALSDMGDHKAAQAAHEASLALAQASGNVQGAAVSTAQLGTLALHQGKRQAAAERYREVLRTFQQLGEPVHEAATWHQLGRVYQEDQQWEEAETAYREAARIFEQHGMLTRTAGAVQSWHQLAEVSQIRGHLAEAEAWYRKALHASREAGDNVGLSGILSNLAGLLCYRFGCLEEAQHLAEEALAIKQTLDHNATEIWTTYDILADIAEQQPDPSQAHTYRRLARQAYRTFPGVRQALQRHGPLIAKVVAAVAQPAQRAALEAGLAQIEQRGWGHLVAAIRHILAGGRDETTVNAHLNSEDSLIVETILCGIADPQSLAALRGYEGHAPDDEAAGPSA